MNSYSNNELQEKIIKDSQTPAAVIAGPGTGKTYTIVGLVVDLVKNKNIPLNKILITTFTRKAANELNTRIISACREEGINTDLSDLKIGNFHSLAIDYLEKYRPMDEDFFTPQVIDDATESYLIEKNAHIFREVDGFAEMTNYGLVRRVREIFETITNNLIDLDKLKNSDNPKDRWSYEIYIRLERLLRSNKLINFQMILMDFYKLLSDPYYGEKIREDIDYLIIDEYQDTNYIQEEIAFKLLKNHNIMVFGDDDQSLYSFRGADPKNLLDFSRVCEEKLGISAHYYNLSVNYRSNQAIVDFSNKWMDLDDFERPVKKDLLANDETVSRGSVAKIDTNKVGFLGIYKDVISLSKKVPLNEIAFLFPKFTTPYTGNLQRFFENRGIDVINYSSTEFFNRREIRILIYIFVNIFGDYHSFDESIYIPKLDYETRNRIEFNNYLANIYGEESFKSPNLLQFTDHFRNKADKTLTEVLYKAFGIDVMREILDQKLGTLRADRALNNISKFTNIVSDYVNIFGRSTDKSYNRDFIYGYLFSLYKNKAIKEYEDFDNTYDALNFMSIHNSKGLEFEVVFVSGLTDEPKEDYEQKYLFNHEKRHETFLNKKQDFYRKYYTAFSRAKNLLVLMDNNRDQNLNKHIKALDYGIDTTDIKFTSKAKRDEKPILAFTTDIEVYENCPLRYKFFTKLDFALGQKDSLTMGSQIHQLISYIVFRKMDGKDLGDLSKFLETNKNYKPMVSNFLARDFDVKASEKNYKVDRDFYILQGNIDLILADKSIMDIKTGNINTRSRADKLLAYSKQLSTYKELMRLNNEKTNDLLLYFIESDDLIPVDEASLGITEIDRIAKNIIEENIYVKTDDLNICKRCPMKYYCKRY